MKNARIWIVHFFLGLSSGIPLLLTGSTLQVWMTDLHVDIKTIGAFALVGLPYNLKFLWSPLIDRYTLPFLTRRRAWLLISQFMLMAAIILLGSNDPMKSIKMTALLALLVSFMSATQDIVIDAYRREALTEKQMGFGLSLYSTGYRIAMLIAGGVALWVIAQYHLTWLEIYFGVALLIGLGIFATLLAPEPKELSVEPPKTLREAVIGPFQQFFTQKGVLWIFAFLLLYKLGDNLSSAMTAPFVIQHGYSKKNYAELVKGVGIVCTLVGGFVGSAVMAKIGLNRVLWLFGVLQAAAILTLVAVANTPLVLYVRPFDVIHHQLLLLGVAIGCETFTSGMAVPAFNTFIAFLTNRKFTATQYALLTSLAVLPRTIISSPSGWLAEIMGWTTYFTFCAAVAIPGLFLLLKLAPWNARHASDEILS